MTFAVSPPPTRQQAPVPRQGGSRLEQILPLLACPACRGGLASDSPQALRCSTCSATYPVRDGVPILLPASMQEPGMGSADADDPVSRHPYSPKALEIIDAHRSGWVLDLGAGGKLQRWGNVLQVDVFRYPMTDVVATADCLPFRDNAFAAVVSQAVFEHLQYPEAAAAEIRRVLQPHGTLRIDTAFLQPEHGYPHHFFNATETGLRHWFRDFDIEWSGVDAHQHPQWSLSWFLSVYLDRLPPESARVLQGCTLAAVVTALDRAAQGQPQGEDAPLLAALAALPAHELRTLAAGVCVQGRNPAKGDGLGQAAQAPRDCTGNAGQTRELLAARHENQLLREQIEAMAESWTLAVDRGNYLAQLTHFEIDVKGLPALTLWSRLHFALGATARLLVPPRPWLRLRAAMRRRRITPPKLPQAQPPFFTVVLAPRDATALINAFFSLTHQSFTGWELLVLEYPGQPLAVRHVLHDFLRLDQRVRTASVVDEAPSGQLQHAHTLGQGRYLLNLPSGAVLTRRALQAVFTLLRERPHTTLVLADFEQTDGGPFSPAMRCHAAPPGGLPIADPHAYAFALHAAAPALASSSTFAYIPEILFRQTRVPASPG